MKIQCIQQPSIDPSAKPVGSLLVLSLKIVTHRLWKWFHQRLKSPEHFRIWKNKHKRWETIIRWLTWYFNGVSISFTSLGSLSSLYTWKTCFYIAKWWGFLTIRNTTQCPLEILHMSCATDWRKRWNLEQSCIKNIHMWTHFPNK